MGKEGPESGYLTILYTAAWDQLYFSFSFSVLFLPQCFRRSCWSISFHSMKNISGSWWNPKDYMYPATICVLILKFVCIHVCMYIIIIYFIHIITHVHVSGIMLKKLVPIYPGMINWETCDRRLLLFMLFTEYTFGLFDFLNICTMYEFLIYM
jgi:hypothetical protein